MSRINLFLRFARDFLIACFVVLLLVVGIPSNAAHADTVALVPRTPCEGIHLSSSSYVSFSGQWEMVPVEAPGGNIAFFPICMQSHIDIARKVPEEKIYESCYLYPDNFSGDVLPLGDPYLGANNQTQCTEQ